jgi:hypothetical protein
MPINPNKRRQYRLDNYERIREQEIRSRAKHIEKHRADSRERMRIYREENREHYRQVKRVHDLKSKYGLTPEGRDKMLQQQGNCCAICKATTPGRGWHIDHCHKTKRVRGILCQHCNLMLGHAQDNPERLLAAIAYLTPGGKDAQTPNI